MKKIIPDLLQDLLKGKIENWIRQLTLLKYSKQDVSLSAHSLTASRSRHVLAPLHSQA